MFKKKSSVLFINGTGAESCVLEQILREHVLLNSVMELGELERSLQDACYDAVFCSWSLPNESWHEALAYIQLRNPDIPVVIFSRTGGEKEWVEVLEAGAFDFLTPPYTRMVILSLLEQAFDSYEARRLYKATPQLEVKVS